MIRVTSKFLASTRPGSRRVLRGVSYTQASTSSEKLFLGAECRCHWLITHCLLRTVTLRSFGVAPASGPVPVKTSVCLTRGTVMGSVTAGMAVTKPDVSVGVSLRGKANGFKGHLPLTSALREKSPEQTKAAGPETHSFTRMEASCTHGSLAGGGMFAG